MDGIVDGNGKVEKGLALRTPVHIYTLGLRSGRTVELTLREDLGETVVEEGDSVTFHFPEKNRTVRVVNRAIEIMDLQVGTIALPPAKFEPKLTLVKGKG